MAEAPGINPALPSWGYWFRSQINRHPDVIAAKERMYAALSIADSLERPLYNPELDSSYEREGRYNNYRLGLSQRLDWWGKRDTRKQQARYSRTAARQAYKLAILRKSAAGLRALIEWDAAGQQSVLALRQEEQLGTLLNLVRSRRKSGDIGQVDVEMAFLGLSQKLNDAARAQARIKQAEARLQEALPGWSSAGLTIPENFWTIDMQKNRPRRVDEYPLVAAARAKWEVMKKRAALARLQARAEPTVRLSAGKSADDTVVGVTLSIPLNVRNNYSAQTRAAQRRMFAAEAGYRAVRRRQQMAIRASAAALNEYRKRYQRWRILMAGRGQRSGNLLEKQWRSGDMSTTEYLLALQQRTEGLVAGIELRTQYQLARIDWLFQSGQMKAALMQLKQ
ncbi:MAG: TolC family protein [Alphaproteobacteria bacterium]|nr:TolC family protein [Alphaproteobacteria bacterium]